MVYIGIITHLLTFDPNFQRDIQGILPWNPRWNRGAKNSPCPVEWLFLRFCQTSLDGNRSFGLWMWLWMVFCWGGGLGLKVINHSKISKESDSLVFLFFWGGVQTLSHLEHLDLMVSGGDGITRNKKWWKKVNVKHCYSSRTSDRWFGVVYQKFTPEKQHVNGKITYSTWIIGYTSSNGWFSIVMLVFPGIYWSMEHVSTLLSGGGSKHSRIGC